MVVCEGTENSENMSEMDKIIEDFLMPPPDSTKRSFVLRNSTDSLRDGSSSSLDKSNNSSSTTTSWNSSCSCHSMKSLSNSGNKSSFIFHKQSILPPLLCSSSRTEMRVYKMKAVEKEQKRKEKEKQRLISRVEAILSSVEISPVKTRRHQPSDETIEEEDLRRQPNSSDVTSSHGDKESENDTSDENLDLPEKRDLDGDVTNAHDIEESQNSDEEDVSHHDNSYHHSNHTDVINSVSGVNNKAPKEVADDPSSSDGSSDEVSDFHDNAYRSSLRNLLQKSLSFNQSGNPAAERNSSIKDTQPNKSSSESDEDITGNTVIDVRPDLSSHEDSELHDSDQQPLKYVESEPLSEEETLVESIVDAVIDEAKKEVANHNNPHSPLLNHDIPACDVTNVAASHYPDPETRTKNRVPGELSSWETPKVQKDGNQKAPGSVDHMDEEKAEISPCSISSCQFFELHNQSTSTKVNAPVGPPKEQNWEEIALEKFADLQNFAAAEQPPQPPDDDKEAISESSRSGSIQDIEQGVAGKDIGGSPFHSPQASASVIELSGTLCFENTVNEAYPPKNQVSVATSNDDLTVLKPVLSETFSDATSMSPPEDNMKENCDPAIEQAPLSSLKRSLSFTLDRPSGTFESAVIEAVSQHFHGFQDKNQGDGNVSPDLGNDRAAVKEKKLLQARVRRGSYTLDEPSPYLVKNKDSLTIESGALDDDVYSETTCEAGEQDVKRKLDLVSDSEESSLPASVKKFDVKGNGQPSKAELNVANLCKILQDQHVQQMELMKQRHQQQLQSLQKELIHGESKMSLPLDGGEGVVVPPLSHDATVSPSLASTEYKDIRLRSPRSEEPIHYYVNQENHLESMTYQESDVSRITDVELTPNLHEKLCKLSALCKGHLTRQLLGSSRVQKILQIIRDTSRLILSLRSEINESQGMDSITDTYLEDRLYTQLRSAMHDLHHIFFDITIGERMFIIAQSSVLEKLPKTHRPQKLSAATQKSLERKRLLSSSSPPQTAPSHGKVTHKEVKSKISHIWKTDPAKPAEKKSPPVKLPSSTANPARRSSNKPHVMSQTKSKSPMTPQSRPVTSVAKSTNKSPTNSQNQLSTSQEKAATSKSQKKDVTSQPRRPGSTLKSNPPKLKSVSSLKSQSNGSTGVIGKSAISQSSAKPSVQGSKVMQRKISKGRKPAPLANANKTNILSK